MFASIRGKILSINYNSLVVENSGLGFCISVASPEAYHQGQEITLMLHMHWNQEQGPLLFGFGADLEKKVFLLITSCSGIGPKIGLAVLSKLSPADFLAAVQAGDSKALSAVNGIGPKKADQMMVQLRDKVTKFIDAGDVLGEGQVSASLEHWKNLTQVLQSLNYSRAEIDAALAYLRKEHGGKQSSFDALVRHSLSFLAKKV